MTGGERPPGTAEPAGPRSWERACRGLGEGGPLGCRAPHSQAPPQRSLPEEPGPAGAPLPQAPQSHHPHIRVLSEPLGVTQPHLPQQDPGWRLPQLPPQVGSGVGYPAGRPPKAHRPGACSPSSAGPAPPVPWSPVPGPLSPVPAPWSLPEAPAPVGLCERPHSWGADPRGSLCGDPPTPSRPQTRGPGRRGPGAGPV